MTISLGIIRHGSEYSNPIVFYKGFHHIANKPHTLIVMINYGMPNLRTIYFFVKFNYISLLYLLYGLEIHLLGEKVHCNHDKMILFNDVGYILSIKSIALPLNDHNLIIG